MAVKQKVVSINTQQAQTSVKDLRTQLKQLKDTMLSTEQGTEEYNNALTKAAEIQHTLKEQMEYVNATAMDSGQIFSNANKALGGMVGGFQAVIATMNLFGIENEEVIKSLQKMQNLMSISQALPAIDKGIHAFRKLSLAIKGTSVVAKALQAALQPKVILAAVAAVSALVIAYNKLTQKSKDLAKQQKELNDISVDGAKNTAKQTNNINVLLKVAKDETLSLQQRKAAIEKLNSIIPEYNAKLDETSGKYIENKTALDKYIDSLITQATAEAAMAKMDEKAAVLAEKKLKYQKEYAEAQQKLYNDIVAASGQAYADAYYPGGWQDVKPYQDNHYFTGLRKDIEKLEGELQNVYDTYKDVLAGAITLQDNTSKEVVSKAEKTAKELEILMWEAIQKMTPASLQEELLAKFGGSGIPIPIKLVIDEDEEEDTSFEDEFRQRVESTVEGLRAAFSTSEEERYAEEQRLLEVALNTKLITQEEYYKLSEALAKENAEREKQIQVQKIQAYVDIASNIAGALASIGDMMDDSNKEQFETAKAFNISAAVIGTIAGAIGAYTGAASNPGINAIPMVGPALAQALGITNAIAVTASGAAQIAQLSRQKFGNAHLSKGFSGSKASPNTGAVNSIIAPVQYTQDVQGAQIEGAIKDTRVYVTEGDISSTQKKVDVAESEAEY